MKKRPLSHEEHLEVGRALRELHMGWQARYVALSNRYGKTHPAVVKMRQVNDAMSEARSRMDSQCYIDEPGAFTPHIYYPGDET